MSQNYDRKVKTVNSASEDDMLRDKLVFSINDPRLKERLLRENGRTLQRAIDICRSTELAKAQIQAMQMTPSHVMLLLMLWRKLKHTSEQATGSTRPRNRPQ